MNDEIKEIQERLNYHKAIGIEPEYCEDLITTGELQIILDYITNLQEELEVLKEDNYAYHQLMKMQNKREYRSKFLKEFQEEFGTNTFPDYDEIYKRYDKLKKENERLNNIINELEKYLKEIMESYGYENDITDRIEKIAVKNILNKLKELKNK